MFETFKQTRKCFCGQRPEAIAVGKEIIEKYKNDPLNSEVIEYVIKETAKIEKEDPVCRHNDRYNKSYLQKNWSEFFTYSKEIIAREGDSPLGLDVMLTLVSVGYDRTAIDKADIYTNDTINYARQALQRLNSGKTSEKYGVFVPFKTKENATSWMNYILGFYTDRMAGNDPAKKKEALTYFYKATLTGPENKTDVSIYTMIGDYYFSEASKLNEESRKIRAANNNSETVEAKAKLALARGYADRAIVAFGRARQVATANLAAEKAPNRKARAQKLIDAINKTLTDLYRFRFNIPPEQKPEGLEIYIEKLVRQPFPDPATKVEPVLN